MLIGLDSLVEYHTDSAYQLLTAIQPRVDSLGSKATSMRHLMLLTSARNKLDRLSPSDTTFVDVVDYYDRHGSRNDQMKARYLLGCIYKEMGESPLAITTFESAVDCADTLAPDCDWLTLLSIHGQAAATYRWQFNPSKEMEEGEKYCQCALKLDSKREYAIGLEIMEFAATTMNDTAKVLDLANKSREVYLKLGLNQEAAKESLFPMLYYVERKMWNQAEELIDSFESAVPINDSSPDDQVVERYHYVKGMLYLGKGQTEDAEREFRVMSSTDYGYYRNLGLLNLFRVLGNPDSTYVYSMRCENSIGRTLGRRESTSLAAASANYKYDRIAGKEAEERHKAGLLKTVLVIVLTLVLLSLALWMLLMRRRRKELERLRSQIHVLSDRIEQTVAETDLLKQKYDVIENAGSVISEKMLENVEQFETSDKDGHPTNLGMVAQELKDSLSYILETRNTFLSTKTLELEQLFTQMNLLNSSLQRLLSHGSSKASSIENLINELNEKGLGHKKKSVMTQKEANLLEKSFSTSWPNLSESMNYNNLTPQEKIVCILTFLGFSSKQICVLMDKQFSRISNIKNNVNAKMFGIESAKSLKENLKIYSIKEESD